ncbi:MAG: AAA family ATPase [Alphaproteobacteria bacterium]|nr:AAA family ATPase [Alphaproteobacteria bacterium]
MNSPEINQIEDVRILGEVSRLASKYADYEEFKRELETVISRKEKTAAKARMTVARRTGNEPAKKRASLQMPSEEALKKAYNYSRQEDKIISSAINLVQDQKRSLNDNPTPVHKDWEINEIGQQIAEGPGLTVLDGGPGAGKSFSLGKAVDVMQVPVICLGSTKSAAAGLYKDMNDAQSDKDKEAKKNEEKIKQGKKPKEIAPKIDILGGLTVDQLLQKKPLKDKDLQARKEKVLEQLKKTPKPCIMVDEAGLLGHKEMRRLLNFVEKNGAKVILAGDCQQIPEGKGQPFKTLVESLKGTKAYVNAPYVFRQSCFSEKAITSGIYNGLSSNNPKEINKDKAVEFLEAAYAITGGPAKPPKNGEMTFQDYLKDPKIQEMPGDTPVQKYVTYLEKNKDSLLKEGTGTILHNYEAHAEYESALKALEEAKKAQEKAKNEGKTDLPPLPKEPKEPDVPKPSYDSYMCAALAAQQMGVQAYETRGQTQEPSKDIYKDVAKDFAENYSKSLENGLEARKRTALEKGKDYTTLKQEYPDGKLAITATEKEADELNAAIRKEMIDQGKLPAKEPVIINGDRKLLSQTEIEAAQKAGKKVKYAYALDVKTTQGMSQTGKVTFVVRGDTMDKMHGGEILVGATRHKGEFEIKMDQDAHKNKQSFYKASVQQFASARVIKDAFQPDLHNAAPKDTSKKGKHSLQDRIKAAKKERKNVMAQLKTIHKNRALKQQAVTRKKDALTH